MRSPLMILVAALALASCGEFRILEVRAGGGGLILRVEANQLVLINGSAAAIHYVAMEERESTMVDLYFDPKEWPSVAPNSQQRIAYRDLMGYRPGDEQARVYWWTEEDGHGHLVVKLRT